MLHRYLLLRLCLLLLVVTSWTCQANKPTDSSEEAYPFLFESPSFALVDAEGNPFPSSRLEGHTWLVDFIFTRCDGPCPLMSQKLSQVQRELQHRGLLGKASRIRLVSITVDPEYDTPEVLADYSLRWEADPQVWHFLTGPPAEVNSLVEDGFKTALNRAQASRDIPDISHGTAFLLVGPNGWVRNILRMDDPDFIEEAISSLEVLSQASSSSQ